MSSLGESHHIKLFDEMVGRSEDEALSIISGGGQRYRDLLTALERSLISSAIPHRPSDDGDIVVRSVVSLMEGVGEIVSVVLGDDLKNMAFTEAVITSLAVIVGLLRAGAKALGDGDEEVRERGMQVFITAAHLTTPLMLYSASSHNPSAGLPKPLVVQAPAEVIIVSEQMSPKTSIVVPVINVTFLVEGRPEVREVGDGVWAVNLNMPLSHVLALYKLGVGVLPWVNEVSAGKLVDSITEIIEWLVDLVATAPTDAAPDSVFMRL